MKKRLVTVMLCATMALTLFGCGNSSEKETDETADETVVEAIIDEEEYIKIIEENSMVVELTMDNVNDYVELVLVDAYDDFGVATGEMAIIAKSKIYDEGYVVYEQDVNCAVELNTGTTLHACVFGMEIGTVPVNTDVSITNVKGNITFVKKDVVREYSIENGSRTLDDFAETGQYIFADYPY